MEQTFEEAVLKTVMFWSDKSFRTPLNQNNGDNSENGAMSFMLMNMVSGEAQKSVTENKVKQFEKYLTQILMDKSDEAYVELSVDYNPCNELKVAAGFAELDFACFPCKTFTRIEKDRSVTAKYQYGGEFIKL